ncbi:MAG: hypothetical protein H6605_04175 [Flavobacteriales bacterium]|nr:hypothetical protein [Flavobacteriales bacterium]
MFKKKHYIYLPIIFCLILPVGLFSLRVPAPDKQNTRIIHSQVKEVLKGEGKNDIVLKLRGENMHLYLNRALEQISDLDSFRKELLNKKAKVYYIEHASLFDVFGKTRHVYRIDQNDRILYNEEL